MPFTPYRSSFDPETLQVLQKAFDMAWAEAVALPGVKIDEQTTRELIAKRIVAAAQENGERAPARLKRHALQALRPNCFL